MAIEQPVLERTFRGKFSADDVLRWIDDTLNANAKLKPRGIRVSNNLHNNVGINGEYRGLKIAMDPNLYPDDVVQIQFD